jgi:signal transduction histidine kinase
MACGPHFYVLFGLVLQTYLYFAQPLYLAVMATSLLLVPIAFDVGIRLLRAPAPEGRRFGYRFVAVVSFMTVAASVVRLVAMGLLRHEASPYFAASFANTLFFFLVLFLILTMSFGIITLVHERLVAELKAEHDDRMRVQQQLAKMEQIATVGRMAGGIAHFFNNQMAVIQLACPLLREAVITSKATVASLIEEIDKAARRTSSITSRLQQYAQSKILRSSFDPPTLRRAGGDDLHLFARGGTNFVKDFIEQW